MDLNQVNQVREVESMTEVNKLLGDGWVLLGVAAGKSPETGEAYHLYSLGKPSGAKGGYTLSNV